jgi:hypothetical protein
MPDITVSANVNTLMQAANFSAFRTSLGLGALATVTPGTGIATALAINVGSAGAPVLFNGAGGTPTSIVLTNATGTAASLTAGTASAVAVGGITGLGTGVGTMLATFSSANIATACTDETGSGVLVFGTSPAFTTSVTTGSTTFAVFNTTATTVNAFGAATTLNIGAGAATVLNFGGFTSAAELRFLEPSGSGTNYSGFKQAALAASITYTLPVDAPANGDVLTAQSTGVLSWEPQSGAANAVTLASAAAGAGLLIVSAGADRTASATDTVATINATTANVTTLQMAENGDIKLDAALSADGKYCGITEAGTAGATLAFGDCVYLAAADSRWELADADAASTSGEVKIGMCVLAAAADGDPTVILLYGKIRADAVFPAFTISAPVYIGTTAGDVQVAQPSGTDDVIRVVGYGNTADELFFCPSSFYITHT